MRGFIRPIKNGKIASLLLLFPAGYFTLHATHCVPSDIAWVKALYGFICANWFVF